MFFDSWGLPQLLPVPGSMEGMEGLQMASPHPGRPPSLQRAKLLELHLATAEPLCSGTQMLQYSLAWIGRLWSVPLPKEAAWTSSLTGSSPKTKPPNQSTVLLD